MCCLSLVGFIETTFSFSEIKKTYYAYFGCKLGDQDKLWAPHIICNTCSTSLRKWFSRKIKSMPFAVPMIWREPTNHATDCYFCMTNVKGMNKKNKNKIKYPDIPSAIRPVPHSDDRPFLSHLFNFLNCPRVSLTMTGTVVMYTIPLKTNNQSYFHKTILTT